MIRSPLDPVKCMRAVEGELSVLGASCCRHCSLRAMYVTGCDACTCVCLCACRMSVTPMVVCCHLECFGVSLLPHSYLCV